MKKPLKEKRRGYELTLKVLIIPDPEPFNNQTTNELPQTLPSFDPTCYSEDGNSLTYNSRFNLVYDSPNVFNPPLQPPPYSYEFCGNDAYYGHVFPLQVPLSIEEPDNSLSMGDEHSDTILATESDKFIKSSVEDLVPIPSESEVVMEIVIPEVGGIDADIILTIKDDILHEKLFSINILIANIEALKDNPTPSFDFMTMSSSTSLNFLLEETNTFDNSLPKSKTFCFDLKEISSGSTTTRSDISLPD
nr:hypothetical protein [Tanacetum cinerariifolium]